MESELVGKGWTKSFPQETSPSAIQHTAFTKTTKAGDTYILDYHPGPVGQQETTHGTSYWKVYKEVNGEKQVYGRIGPKGFHSYDKINNSPVFVDGKLVN